jgi:CSLREA domain-containing protein
MLYLSLSNAARSLRVCAAILTLAAGAAQAATLTVNSTADVVANDGVCTLREAITAANTNTASGGMVGECVAGAAGLDTIAFNIAGAGVKTITPASLLPTITEALFINGYTQPGTSANTNAFNAGINAVLLIEVDGTLGGSQTTINAAGTTIRGIVFNRGGEIRVDASNVTIAGNFMGTNPAGTVAMGNPVGGFAIRQVSGNNNVVGGAGAADRNLLSGDTQGGVIVTNGDGTLIQGNYIGPDITGSTSLSGFGRGVVILGGSLIFDTSNTVISGNLISGNGFGGLDITSTGGLLLQGNLIGTQRDGVGALGNGQIGVVIPAGSGNVVGGTGAGQGNTIAFNQAGGVSVRGPSGFNNSILGNSIYSNGSKGIDLSGSGIPLANDPCDVDTLPGNRGQNYPVITSASIAAGNVTISGTLNSTASTTFRIEFFSNVTANLSGNGEGQTFIGFANVTTNGTCNASFGPLVFAVPPGQTVFSATATDPANNTSEFSVAFAAGAPAAAPPTIAKSFGAASIALNGSTSLSFTINNPNAATTLTGVGFTDTLPAGLVVSTPNALTGSCGGGTITATAGLGAISLTGATLAGNSSCAFSANVTGTTVGTKNNTTGAVTSTEGGAGGTASAGVTVLGAPACPAITVNPLTLPSGTVGTPYNQTVSASGGTSPYTFSVSSGTLPAGLILNAATGAITGTPNTAGTFNFSITATDAVACSGSSAYTPVIAAAAGQVPAGGPTLDFIGLTILIVLLAGAGLFVVNRFSL